jgi:hypothetical protein
VIQRRISHHEGRYSLAKMSGMREMVITIQAKAEVSMRSLCHRPKVKCRSDL